MVLDDLNRFTLQLLQNHDDSCPFAKSFEKKNNNNNEIEQLDHFMNKKFEIFFLFKSDRKLNYLEFF